jgi:hypothetical protein
MHCVGLSDRVCADLAETDTSDLPFPDQLCQGLHRSLDWGSEVNSYQVLAMCVEVVILREY